MRKRFLNIGSLAVLIVLFLVASAVILVQTGVIDLTVEPEKYGSENTSGIPVVEASAYPGIDGEQLEIAIYEEVNERRVSAGRNRLVHSEKVRLIARIHSKDMADRGFYDHTNPDGLGSRGRHEKYDGCKDTNENINLLIYIETNATYETAEAVVDSWANSPGHNKSMMTSYDHVTGVGVYVTENKSLYVTQNFCREHPNA